MQIAKPLLLAALFVGWMATPAVAATDTPHRILMSLKNQMILLGEKRASGRSFEKAVERAADDLREFEEKNSASPLLVERDVQGMTPLMAATFEGYAPLVEVLLKNKTVRAGIDNTDAKGLTAWTYANFAPKQTLWLCNPSLLQNSAMIRPLKVVQPYYIETDPAPYPKIRSLLAAAGARADMKEAKTKWNNLCRGQYMEVASKVSAAVDLQKTVIAEAGKALH